ncbi:unnamed protein product [Caenorhabditis auriculariae]|uniref:guanylate cyclase n=1 Tax=Caenorhabditis auriculariae TaxID=2777116 RepID=A0A8S1GU51_9PELO|nr:unnamed protein product [Caenorhabditis auriculariae]
MAGFDKDCSDAKDALLSGGYSCRANKSTGSRVVIATGSPSRAELLLLTCRLFFLAHPPDTANRGNYSRSPNLEITQSACHSEISRPLVPDDFHPTTFRGPPAIGGRRRKCGRRAPCVVGLIVFVWLADVVTSQTITILTDTSIRHAVEIIQRTKSELASAGFEPGSSYQWQTQTSEACNDDMTSLNDINLLLSGAIKQSSVAVIGPTCQKDVRKDYGKHRREYYRLGQRIPVDWGKFSEISRMIATKSIAITKTWRVQPNTPRQTLATMFGDLTDVTRVVVALLGNNLADYTQFLQAFYSRNYTAENGYTPVLVLTRFSLQELSLPWESDPSLLNVYDKALILYNDKQDRAKISDFARSFSFQNDDEALISIQLYEAMYTMAQVSNTVSPESVRGDLAARNITTPFGTINFNKNGYRITGFNVRLINGSMSGRDAFQFLFSNIPMSCDATITCLIADVSSTSYDVNADSPICGYNHELCSQLKPFIVILLGMILLLICTYIYVRLVRKFQKTKRSLKSPWVIPIEEVKFTDLAATEGQRVQTATKTRFLATVDQLYVIAEKYFVKDRLRFDKIDSSILFNMRRTQHDNLNTFIGFAFDKQEIYQIWTQCFRGNLADLLLEPKMENGMVMHHNFRGAFVRDILKPRLTQEHASAVSYGDPTAVEATAARSSGKAADWGSRGHSPPPYHCSSLPLLRQPSDRHRTPRSHALGLDYIHLSEIGFHGALTSANCMIDSHWILKLSGFGVARLLYKWVFPCLWRAANLLFTHDRRPIIANPELHYYAPELRGLLRTHMTSTRTEKIHFTNAFGRTADIFSFGVVLYEILYGQKYVNIDDKVYQECTLMDLEAESRVPDNPDFPHSDDVHPDLVELIQKCWTRQPELRPDPALARKITDATLKMSGSLVDQMMKNMEMYTNGLELLVAERTGQLEEEQMKADMLLSELLPPSIAEELKNGRMVHAKTYNSATILYSDIVGFTSLCSESQPMEVVALLSGMYQTFDRIISQQNGYKMETIGDAYCVASGIPIASETAHVKNIAMVALLQRDFLHKFEIPHRPGQYLKCRWGFNSGSVFTGVVGIRAPRYAVFGPTVTIAAKLESSGVPDRIQMSLASQKSIGTLLTYWLEGVDEEKAKAQSAKIIQVDPTIDEATRGNQDSQRIVFLQYIDVRRARNSARPPLLEELEELDDVFGEPSSLSGPNSAGSFSQHSTVVVS